MSKNSKMYEDRMKVRTYGVWPVGSWQQVAPTRIACVRVTPSYDQPHPSGAPASEVEIVFEMSEPQEAGGRHSLVLDTDQVCRLTALLNAAWRSTGGSEPFLFESEQITIGARVRVSDAA